VTVGIAYDIIQEPPAFGAEQDPKTGACAGRWRACRVRVLKAAAAPLTLIPTHPPPAGGYRPVTFMPYRINGQYIMEGISGGMMYSLGGEARGVGGVEGGVND
jgi:hypothetical protein